MTARKPSRKAQQEYREVWYADLFKEIPDGWTPLEAVVSVKCLDDEGNVCLVTRKTSGLAPWDAYGMLSYACEDYSSSALAAAGAEDDDE